MKQEFIYLDNNATTRIDPRVLEAMMPFLTDVYSNAASDHMFGKLASDAVNNARKQVADLIDAEPHEIVFTSGATEAINLALKGVAARYGSKGKHIVTVATEHPAMLDTCSDLEARGFEISYLPVQPDGLLNLDVVKDSVRPDTILVSVMLVNNETGVVQPIKEIAELTHRQGALFMTDATQAVGKMPVSVNELQIDLMSFSGHKFYGPKGIGGLYVRGKRPNRVKLEALLHGGGHENGLRSGTLNVPAIIGLGKAAEIAKQEMKREAERVDKLKNALESGLLKIKNTFVNGHKDNRLHNVSNICFRGADADAMIGGLKDIMVSNGSACSSTKVEPSHVLTAMGVTVVDCYSSLRFSLGKFNTKEEIDFAIEAVKKVVAELRAMNPS